MNQERCECHDCTQARWKSTLQGQIESAMQNKPVPLQSPFISGTSVAEIKQSHVQHG